MAATDALLLKGRACSWGLVQRLWREAGFGRRTGIRDRKEALFRMDGGGGIPTVSMAILRVRLAAGNYSSTGVIKSICNERDEGAALVIAIG